MVNLNIRFQCSSIAVETNLNDFIVTAYSPLGSTDSPVMQNPIIVSFIFLAPT
jgi:hypothetical protein